MNWLLASRYFFLVMIASGTLLLYSSENLNQFFIEKNDSTSEPSPQDGSTAPVNFDESIFNWMRSFAEVIQTSHHKHYNLQNPENAMKQAMSGYISALDPHSSFLDPKTYKSILEATSGEFFGIGIVIDTTRKVNDKFLLVVDTIPGGPADSAGVKRFDKIIDIDGKSLDGMTTEEATSKLKGERHTKVTIKIMREGHPDIITMDIMRDEIKEQASTCFYLPDQNIYYLSLTMFTDSAVQQLEKLLHQVKIKPYKGLILDLRGNSGGLLTAAIDIAGLFLDKGSLVVSTKGKGNKETQRYETTRQPLVTTAQPIFILINNYTASAAEILAGCLKLHSNDLAKKSSKEQKKLMVFVVGTKSFGKGTVQEILPLGNNCALKITTAVYELPFNTPIQGVGLEPDIVIEKLFPPTEQILWFNENYARESALTNYIKSENSTAPEKKTEPKKTDKSWSDRAKDSLEKDNQFRDAVTLINLLHTGQTHFPALVKNREKAVEFLKNNYITNTPLKMVDIKI